MNATYNSYGWLQNQIQLFVQDGAMSSVPKHDFTLYLPLFYYQSNSRYDFFPFRRTDT